MKKPRPVAKPRSHDAISAATLTVLKSDPKSYLLQQNGHDGIEQFYLVPLGWEIPRDRAFALIGSSAIVPGNAGLMINGPQIWRIAQ